MKIHFEQYYLRLVMPYVHLGIKSHKLFYTTWDYNETYLLEYHLYTIDVWFLWNNRELLHPLAVP